MNEHNNNPSRRITSFNERQMRQIKRENMRIRKRRVFAGALVATNLIAAISFYNIGSKAGKNSVEPPTIPSGYVLTETIEVADYGDTVYGIASEYYNPSYAGIYPTLNDYTDAIIESNNLNKNADIDSGDSLRLPVVASTQNDYFVRALEIQKEIDDITRTNYWVEYTIQPGDTISHLAARASGDFRETPILTQKILEKNNVDGVLRDGTTILTINPALGPLKIELQEVQKQFQTSIKNNQDTLTQEDSQKTR